MFKCTDSVGDLAIFVDLPGYGFAKMSKAQQEEIARFLRSYLEERGI
jgi:GTP-binding protein EngB required for normal cell division